MLLWVPLPVWKTTRGNSPTSLPEMTCTQMSIRALQTRRGLTHLISSLLDRLSNLRVQSVSGIDDRSRFLQHTERLDERLGEAFLRASDVEVLQRTAAGRAMSKSKSGATPLASKRMLSDVPLRLSPPVAVCGDLELAEGVALDTILLLLHSTRVCQNPLQRRACRRTHHSNSRG